MINQTITKNEKKVHKVKIIEIGLIFIYFWKNE